MEYNYIYNFNTDMSLQEFKRLVSMCLKAKYSKEWLTEICKEHNIQPNMIGDSRFELDEDIEEEIEDEEYSVVNNLGYQLYKDYENRLCNAIGYLSEDIEIEELLELRKCALLKLPVDFFKNLKYRSSRDIIYERQVTIRKMHPGFNYEEIDKCGNINNIDYYLLLLAKINKEFRLDIKTSYDSIVHNEREVTPIIRFIEEASKSWNIR